MTETPRDDLLRIRDVLARVHVSRATFYRLVKRGEAPAPIHLGRTALWSSAAVDAWIAALTTGASRGTAAANDEELCGMKRSA